MSASTAQFNVATVAGGVTGPTGFRSAAVASGIKKKAGALDLAVIAADTPVPTAALFTTNLAQAAPVLVSTRHLTSTSGMARAIVVNAGCANACTGDDGLANAERMTAEVAAALGCVFAKQQSRRSMQQKDKFGYSWSQKDDKELAVKFRSRGPHMIKIWGRTDSSNVQKVLWCCAELGIDFERVDWGGKFGGNNEQAYREMNPNGLVPTLKDGDFILWESNSIMRYLNVKYGGGRLLPATPEGVGNANRWMDWQLSTFNPTIVPLFWNLVRTPADKRDPKAVEAALDKTIKAWELVESQLAKTRFLGGEDFSLGDIPLGVWAYRWFNLPIERPAQPNLNHWYERLKQRKPYQTHIMIPVT